MATILWLGSTDIPQWICVSQQSQYQPSQNATQDGSIKAFWSQQPPAYLSNSDLVFRSGAEQWETTRHMTEYIILHGIKRWQPFDTLQWLRSRCYKKEKYLSNCVTTIWTQRFTCWIRRHGWDSWAWSLLYDSSNVTVLYIKIIITIITINLVAKKLQECNRNVCGVLRLVIKLLKQ